jgi:ribonuclease H2 subunit C
MDKPILSLAPSDAPKATANLLPCRINHDGSVEPVDTFWDPRTSEGKLQSPPPLHAAYTF